MSSVIPPEQGLSPVESIPLVIGVVGHDDIDFGQSADTVAWSFRRLLRNMRRNYPHTRLLLLCDPKSAVGQFVLPLAREEQVEPPENVVVRDQSAVVGHCQVLIVLWDGDLTHGEHGVTPMVRFQLEGIPPRRSGRSPIDPLPRSPVWHIVTPRIGRPNFTTAGQVHILLNRSSLGNDAPHAPVVRVRSWRHPIVRLLDSLVRLQDWLSSLAMAILALFRWRLRYLGRYAAYMDRLEKFNGVVENNPEWVARQRQRTRLALAKHETIPEESASGGWPDVGPGIPDEPPEPLLARVADADQRRAVTTALALYQAADALAQWYQRSAGRLLFWMFALGCVGTCGRLVSLRVHDAKPWLSPVVITCLGIGFLIMVWLWWYEWRRRSEDYRALAEGLRVQIFWRLADIWDCPADHYPRTQRRDLDWVHLALRNTCLISDVAPAPASSGGRFHLDLVRWCWVDGQTHYFDRAAPRDSGRFRRLNLIRYLFLIVGGLGLLWEARVMVLSFILPADWAEYLSGIRLVPADLDEAVPDWVFQSVSVMVSYGCFLLGASAAAYGQKLGLRTHAERYRRMRELFGQARRYFAEPAWGGRPVPPDRPSAQALLRDLGQEALRENARWLREQRKHDDEGMPS